MYKVFISIQPLWLYPFIIIIGFPVRSGNFVVLRPRTTQYGGSFFVRGIVVSYNSLPISIKQIGSKSMFRRESLRCNMETYPFLISCRWILFFEHFYDKLNWSYFIWVNIKNYKPEYIFKKMSLAAIYLNRI